MVKHPEAPDRKRCDTCAKEPSRQMKEPLPFSVVTSGVTTLRFFLLVVEGPMRLSLHDAFANLYTRSSRLLYYDPRLKH